MKKILIIAGFLILALTNCKEVYDPNTQGTQSILVVQGLITTDNATYKVKLSRAIPYSSLTKSLPEVGATVTVSDQDGNLYLMNGDGKGNYLSDSTVFTGVSGNRYVLHIDTKNGEKYESATQLMKNPSRMDSIKGATVTQKYFIKDTYGDYFPTPVDGVESFASVSSDIQDSIAGCRFDVSLDIEYHVFIGGMNSHDWYDWYITRMNTNVYLTQKTFATDKTNVFLNQSVGFFPTDFNIYGMDDYGKSITGYPMQLYAYGIFIRQYSLNQDSYSYYKQISIQLANSGGLFDPIGSQIKGNMKCISNPNQIALGLFEASPKVTSLFMVTPNKNRGTVIYTKWNADLDKVPQKGEVYNIMPYFYFR